MKHVVLYKVVYKGKIKFLGSYVECLRFKEEFFSEWCSIHLANENDVTKFEEQFDYETD